MEDKVVTAILNLIQEDPHQWSERPCPTCKAIGSMINRRFGCYVYAHRKAEERNHALRSPKP